MARGRMLNKSISKDRAVAELIEEVGGLGAMFYTWLIAWLDRYGRAHGDVRILKGEVAPLVDGIDHELIEDTVAAADRLGLLRIYSVDGGRYIAFPKFAKNQTGLRVDRESDSGIPEPPTASGEDPDVLRSDAGSDPAQRKRKHKRKDQDQDQHKGVAPVAVGSGDETDQRVACVFEYYCQRYPKRRAQAQKPDTRALIRQRLAEGYSVEDLCTAIDGNAGSDFYTSRGLTELRRIVADAESVDKFIALTTAPKENEGAFARVTRELLEDHSNALPPIPGPDDAPAGLLPGKGE